MKVIPFGYSIWNSRNVMDRLMSGEDTLLIDIRYSTKSIYKPEWSHDQLNYRYEEEYIWIQELGNINYYKGGPIKLFKPEIGIRKVIELLKNGYTLILLCTCKTYATCHRKIVIDLLKEELPDLEIEYPRMGIRL